MYLFLCLCRTKLLFRSARLIRFPFDVRGKDRIVVGKGFTTGRYCRIETEAIDAEIRIGKNFQMNDLCHIAALQSVVIGDNVLVASKVFISDLNHGRYSGPEAHDHPDTPPADRKSYARPVVIEDNVWIGDGVCILAGARIGRGSIIGANSVVTGIIPPDSIALGIPAKVKKTFNRGSGRWESISPERST